MNPLFFTGLHHPADAKHFDRAFVSVNALRNRKGPFPANDWILDSGAFTEITKHGTHRYSASEYANQVHKWAACGNLLAAVTQDWMCEPFVLSITGKTLREHQRLTLQRYDALLGLFPTYLMPVLQGYEPGDYVIHLNDYGDRLADDAWVGVGSVCKRNGSVNAIEDVLGTIKSFAPNLKLHGFGLKKTALKSATVCQLLHSCDSMAWSFAARRCGRNANDWREAKVFEANLHDQPKQFAMRFNNI